MKSPTEIIERIPFPSVERGMLRLIVDKEVAPNSDGEKAMFEIIRGLFKRISALEEQSELLQLFVTQVGSMKCDRPEGSLETEDKDWFGVFSNGLQDNPDNSGATYIQWPFLSRLLDKAKEALR